MVNKKRIGAIDAFIMSCLLIVAFLTIYPFINMLFISVSPMNIVVENNLMLFPKEITFSAYEYVLRYGRLEGAFGVTLFITIVGTIINLVLTSLGAYVVAQKNVPGRRMLMSMMIFTLMFSGGLIPTYMVVKSLGLIDTLWALILPNAINTFWLILMRNFFQQIPASLPESARMDGCSEYRILISIILPLSLPILATLALFYGVMHWNAYYMAVIYINSQRLRPLQMVIRAMYDQSLDLLNDDFIPPPVETVRASTVMIATIPILLVYPFIQKYFTQGIMVGAIKG